MKENRQQEILTALEHYHFLTARQCVEMFHRSEATIRRDFVLLHQSGLVKKVHGGIQAVTEDRASPLAPVPLRLNWNQGQKRLLAETAVKHIKPDETLMVHGGTTIMQLAACLGNRNRIITNSPQFCQTITARFHADAPEVILSGGRFDFRSGLILGAQCCSFIRQYQCDVAIASPFGCDPDGITDIDDEYAELLLTVLMSCRKRILLADSSKFRRHGIRRVVPWEKIDMLITSFDPEYQDELERIRNLGVKVLLIPEQDQQSQSE